MAEILMNIAGFCILLMYGIVVIGLMCTVPYCLVHSFKMFKQEKDFIVLGFFVVFLLLIVSLVCFLAGGLINLLG